MLKRLASMPLYGTSVKAKSTEIVSDADRNNPWRHLELWAESWQLTPVPMYGRCESTGRYVVVAPGIRIIGSNTMESARKLLVDHRPEWSDHPLPDKPHDIAKLP